MANWLHFTAALGLVASAPLSTLAQTETAPESASQAQSVVLEADFVTENTDDNTIIAEGNVVALYEGRTLRADRLIYDRSAERVRASGNVIITEADGSQQFADEVEVTSSLTDGYAVGYSARLAENVTIAANSAIRQSDGINAMEQVIYTACPICEEDSAPTWAIRARRAVLDQETQMISYRDAVMEVMGIPVLYLPFLAHPDPQSDRRSGLLFPSVGASSKLGLFYQQPYYWAISEHSDLTIAPQISASVDPLIELDYRKRFFSGAIDINTSFTYEQDFDSDGVKFGEDKLRGHVYGKGRFAINNNWQWGFGIENQTDDLYDRRYDIDGQGERRGLYQAQPTRLLSQIFTVGQGEAHYIDAALLKVQSLRDGEDDASLPTALPVAFSEKYWDLGQYGFASVNLSTAILNRDIGADSQRVSLGAEWSDLNILPGGFTFEPFAEMRGDYYALDEDVSGEESVSRAVGNVGMTLAYPLVRPGNNFDITLEPTIMAAWGFSNVNDPAIPNEDSLLFEMDETSLFEPNGLGAFDLYEGDGKLSAGITARAIWKNGTQISTMVGRRWRSSSDDAFNVESNLDGTTSDWIATISADLGDIVSANTRLRLDDESFQLNAIDATVSAQYAGVRAVAQYYKQDPRISSFSTSEMDTAEEGIFIRGEAQLTDNYSLIFGQLRDIGENLNAKQEYGLAYQDACSRLELIYARSEQFDRTLGPEESIQVRFTLRSIGEFGSSEFD